MSLIDRSKQNLTLETLTYCPEHQDLFKHVVY
jgi:hypothetical protein